MSRYSVSLPSEVVAKVFPKIEARPNTEIVISHGYDATPLMPAYFCDIEPDCEEGIYYGVMGFTKSLNKGQYYEAMKTLGLSKAANAVALDIQY